MHMLGSESMLQLCQDLAQEIGFILEAFGSKGSKLVQLSGHNVLDLLQVEWLWMSQARLIIVCHRRNPLQV